MDKVRNMSHRLKLRDDDCNRLEQMRTRVWLSDTKTKYQRECVEKNWRTVSFVLFTWTILTSCIFVVVFRKRENLSRKGEDLHKYLLDFKRVLFYFLNGPKTTPSILSGIIPPIAPPVLLLDKRYLSRVLSGSKWVFLGVVLGSEQVHYQVLY